MLNNVITIANNMKTELCVCMSVRVDKRFVEAECRAVPMTRSSL